MDKTYLMVEFAACQMKTQWTPLGIRIYPNAQQVSNHSSEACGNIVSNMYVWNSTGEMFNAVENERGGLQAKAC